MNPNWLSSLSVMLVLLGLISSSIVSIASLSALGAAGALRLTHDSILLVGKVRVATLHTCLKYLLSGTTERTGTPVDDSCLGCSHEEEEK